jgi:hypothetical protein
MFKAHDKTQYDGIPDKKRKCNQCRKQEEIAVEVASDHL